MLPCCFFKSWPATLSDVPRYWHQRQVYPVIDVYLSSGSDGRSGGRSHGLRLGGLGGVTSLSLLGLFDDGLLGGQGLKGRLGLGLSGLALLGVVLGLLLGGLLGGLLLALGSTLALDSSTELRECALGGLVLTLNGSRGLLTLAEEGDGRLALLLDVLLGLGGGSRGLGSVDSSRGAGVVVHSVSQRSGSLNRGDDGGVGLRLGSLNLLGGLSSVGGLRLRSLLLLLGENTTEEAVALGCLLLGALSLGLLNGLGLLSLSDLGLSLRLGRLLSSDDGLLGGLGSFALLSLLNLVFDLVLSLGLFLLLFLLLLGLGLVLLVEETEERGALALGRLGALSLIGLLSLRLLLDGLTLLGGFFSLGGLLSLGLLLGLVGSGGRGNSGSDRGSSGSLLLLLSRRGGLEAVKSLLVGVRLSDGGGDLLGLGDLQLELSDPVITLGSVSSLEAVLVALGGNGELVGALGLRLAGISLGYDVSKMFILLQLCGTQHTRLMMPVGAFLSPLKRRPLPVSEAQATLEW